jgi:hypothetical protein
VNKCHPNEKPRPAAGLSRRKGSVSACRATTSKQLCDQCVQASLSCDGRNPCGNYSLYSHQHCTYVFLERCVQKRCRCTFVKFHRQTAPIGPGHDARPSPARLVYPQRNDYGLDPAALSAHSMPDSLYYQKSGFPDDVRSSVNTQDHTSPSLILDSDPATKYQAQSELAGRAGDMLHASSAPQMPGQALYMDPRSVTSWVDWPHNVLETFNGVPGHSNITQNSITSRFLVDESAQLAFPRQFTAPGDTAFSGQNFGSNASTYPIRGRTRGISPVQGRMRRDSLDFGSDSSHPSSAASSTIHLPSDLPQTMYQVTKHIPISS